MTAPNALLEALQEGKLLAVPSLSWVRRHFGEETYQAIRAEQRRQREVAFAAARAGVAQEPRTDA